MANMLSRARFRDEVVESEEEEVSEEYFASEHIHRVCVICQFLEEEYERETLWIRMRLQVKTKIRILDETSGRGKGGPRHSS